MMVLETPWAAALNHLLDAEPWARERLAPFAGAVVELVAPAPFPALRLSIDAGGRVHPAPTDAPVAVNVRPRPDALAVLARGDSQLAGAVEVSGDPQLAAAMLELVRHLRWDAAEDLSRLTGDIVAERIVGAARAFAHWQRDAARRSAEGLMAYAAGEGELLVPRAGFEAHAAGVAALRDALERFAARLDRIAADPRPGD